MSPQREAFARHLASDMSQSEALRQSNIKAAHSKAAAVHQTASRWAADAQVQARVAELQLEFSEHVVLRAVDALREIARIALFDPGGIVDDKGRLKSLHELDDETAAGVATFEISDTSRPLPDTSAASSGSPSGSRATSSMLRFGVRLEFNASMPGQ